MRDLIGEPKRVRRYWSIVYLIAFLKKIDVEVVDYNSYDGQTEMINASARLGKIDG